MATLLTRGWKGKDDASSDKFLHLLKSNSPPTEEESRLIRDLIRDMDAERKALLTKKTRGGRGFWPWRKTNVDGRIWKLTEKIRRHSSILSIIRTIPAEIVQHIFLLSDASPWALSGICRDWRDYACSFPLLWNKLPLVRVGSKSRSISTTTVERCTAMLRYSSNAPLTLQIAAFDRKRLEGIADDLVLNLLASHSSRWHVVAIDLPPVAMASLAPAITGRLPNLQALWLQFNRILDDPEVAEIEAFADAPQLRSLHIHGIFSGNFQVTAPNLTHLTCNWPLPFGLSVLSQFTQLLSLNLTRGRPQVGTASMPANPMTFPHLQQLIAIIPDDPNCTLLRSIIVPSISVVLLAPHPENAIAHVIAMLIRSGQQNTPTIQHFELRHKAVPEPGQTVALLQLMPELRNLGLSMPHVDDIYEFARTDDPAHVLVPHLETCTFFFEPILVSTGRPSDQLRSAVRAVALNRCETPRSMDSSYQADNVYPLRTFELEGRAYTYVIPDTLTFPPTAQDLRCFPVFTQADFENWMPTQGLQRLVELHDQLIDVAPHLYTNCIILGSPPKGWVARVNAILATFEAMNEINPFDLLVRSS
ncbi:hypothetical protein D9619_002332 [Psilocybe cf. subviscida]|uniref:F-box domain-containing protein n=1 Tax=Psilocybe cf. subviscida TaxID=2480587 RepID=A0A8H5EU69_9AGAR|nr:hypothetical protein D9619_002332 [Psilocybe cf. subviscida]